MKAIIIGGGIAGLTAAIALKQSGILVEVYEAVLDIKPVGAGIWMASNAMQVFDRLGFAESVSSKGQALERIAIVDGQLQNLQTLEMEPLKKHFGYPITAIHRADLHQILIEQLGQEALYLGKRLARIEQEMDSVKAIFEDGSEAAGDFLIGADGIHSVVRTQIFPNQTQFRYSGQTCWRGVLPFELEGDWKKATLEAWKGTVRVGISTIGQGQTYWFAVKKAPEHGKDNPETLRENLLKDFGSFAEPVSSILKETALNQIVRNDIIDFLPLKKWYSGRVCLIGDAAHAMTPNMGQGGGQAVEDAYFLGKLFKELAGQSPEQVFKAFQAKRYKKVQGIIRNSQLIGKMAHISWGQGIRNFIVKYLSSPKQSLKMMLKLLSIDY